MESNILNNDSISDESIIIDIQSGNINSFELLVERYKELINIKAFKYNSPCYDFNDYYQEGLFSLYNAAITYDCVNGRASFKTYASICISRSLTMLYRYANRNKNKCFNNAVPLENADNLQKPVISPEEIFLADESYNELKLKINNILTYTEQQVLTKYLKGMSYKQIALDLNVNTKSVDNILQKIRRKLKCN